MGKGKNMGQNLIDKLRAFNYLLYVLTIVAGLFLILISVGGLVYTNYVLLGIAIAGLFEGTLVYLFMNVICIMAENLIEIRTNTSTGVKE